jgi:hypothetical protein
VSHLRRAKMYLLSEHDYPEAMVRISEHQLGDLEDLIARARALNPAVRLDDIVAHIWRLGCYRLGQNLLRRIPVRIGDAQGRQAG